MRIGVTEVFVDDQDKARALYSEVLGLVVKVDASYGDTARWLTVVSPEDPDGTQLLLAPMNDAAAALQAARRQAAHRRCRCRPRTVSGSARSLPREAP